MTYGLIKALMPLNHQAGIYTERYLKTMPKTLVHGAPMHHVSSLFNGFSLMYMYMYMYYVYLTGHSPSGLFRTNANNDK